MIFDRVLKHHNLKVRLVDDISKIKNSKIKSESDLLNLIDELKNTLSSELYFLINTQNHCDENYDIKFFDEIFKLIQDISQLCKNYYNKNYNNPIGVTKDTVETRLSSFNELWYVSNFKSSTNTIFENTTEKINFKGYDLREKLIEFVNEYIENLKQLYKDYKLNEKNVFEIKQIVDLIEYLNAEILNFKDEKINLEIFNEFIKTVNLKKLIFFDNSKIIYKLNLSLESELYFELKKLYKLLDNIHLDEIYSNYENYYSRIIAHISNLSKNIKENPIE